MVIFGWGKVTKKIIGSVFQRSCNYCNTTDVWKLYVIRTWFTLFFIPIIPYKTKYGIGCPRCGSYIELTQEQFEKIKLDILNGATKPSISPSEDSISYQGKNETQANFLKHMEEYKNKQI